MLTQKEKMKGVSRFIHWYYRADLGDGIVIPATLPNEPQVMLGAQTNRNVLCGLLHRHFGSPEKKKILDLACSAGYHTLELARQGAIVIGIDHDVKAIEQARFIQECQDNPNKARFEIMNVFDADFAPESFDIVYCCGLLYHLSDLLGAVQRIQLWCSLGAVIHSCILPGNELRAELGDPVRFPFSQRGEFAFVPTAPLLRRMFEHAGFEVLEMADQNDYSTDGTWHGGDMRDDWSSVTGPAYFALRKRELPKPAATKTLIQTARKYARAAIRI